MTRSPVTSTPYIPLSCLICYYCHPLLLLAAYEDGVLAVFDLHSKSLLFELRGRSNLISTVQFDESRLLADGSGTMLFLHDFSDPPDEPEDLQYVLEPPKKK